MTVPSSPMKLAIVDRVRKLIALAGSANEHEARTSAWLAVKAIRENDLEVVVPRSDAERSGRHVDEPPWRPEPPRRAVVVDQTTRTDRGGWCAQCRERFDAGDWCATSDSTPGKVHAECASAWTVPL